MMDDVFELPTWKIMGIALILIVDGVLIANHQYPKPTPKYVAMVEDIDRQQKMSELIGKNIPKLQDLALTQILDIGDDPLVVVKSKWDIQTGQEDGLVEWDNEYSDRRVTYMEKLIDQNHAFKITDWHGGDTSLPLRSAQPRQTKGSGR
ncbi:unnamed protein product [Cochlearia groenlandica]